jgi:hypothetical protein
MIEMKEKMYINVEKSVQKPTLFPEVRILLCGR